MARDKSAIWYGLFFVLIAGVAREYDQESVRHVPGLFLAPLFASIPLALLYYGYLKIKHLPKEGLKGLRSFFGLFWMTGPLALFYAIPVEYLFTPLTALKVNTGLLALVATWRVVLFARVMSITLKQPFWLMLIEIIWGGSVLATIASFLFTFSLTDVMGGTVHSQETEFKSDVAYMTMVTTFWLGPVLFAFLFAKGKGRKGFPDQDHASPRRLTIPVVLMVVGLAALVLRQPALFRSARLYHLIASVENPEKGMAYMARHDRRDFAHTWPLPPATRGEPLRLWLASKMLGALKPEHPPWMTEEILAYLDAFLSAKQEPGHYHQIGSINYLVAKLPETETVDRFLQRHGERLLKDLEKSSRYLDSERGDELFEAKTRLMRAGVVSLDEKNAIQEFENTYSHLPVWDYYSAHRAMILVSELPNTASANKWLRDHREILSAIWRYAGSDDKLKGASAVFIERLEHAAIEASDLNGS